jgi:hypothetical protein
MYRPKRKCARNDNTLQLVQNMTKIMPFKDGNVQVHETGEKIEANSIRADYIKIADMSSESPMLSMVFSSASRSIMPSL